MSLKGKRQVGTITSAEKGFLLTFAACVSAGSSCISPFVIFQKQKMKTEIQDGALLGSKCVCTLNHCTQSDILMKWSIFLKYAKSLADDPVFLILDDHVTHTQNVPFIDQAKSNKSGLFVSLLYP